MIKNKFNYATITVAFLSIITLISNNFVFIMKNRVSKMVATGGFKFLGSIFWIPVILLLIIMILNIINKSNSMFLTSLISSIIIITLFIFFIIGTDKITAQNPSIRVSFGLSFYFVFILLISLIIKNRLKEKNIIKKYLPMALVLCTIAALFIFGFMDKSSIMIEYHTRKDKFISTLIEHLYLCWTAIITSILLGIPLSYLCHKNKTLELVVMGILNIVRSIPAIALMILMITPLSFLKNIPFFRNIGVSSFGFTPVYCALVLYNLFIIISNITSALKTIDKKYIIAAKGIGFTNLQILFKIQIPIIFPILISGLKVVNISSFTAASLGTMVGFGGLGTFIVMGSGNAVAIDLILLGAIPIMIFIFLTNSILTLIINLFNFNNVQNINK